MAMVVVIDGKRVKCPSSHEELKTRHYQRIVSEWQPEETDLYKKDFFKLFCILTDSHADAFIKTPENEAAIWKAVRWYVETPFIVEKNPPLIFNMGFKWMVLPRWMRNKTFLQKIYYWIFPKEMLVPKSMGGLSSGQNILLLQALNGVKFIDEKISIAVAIVMQPLYDGTDEKPAYFDYGRAKELENIVLEMPIVQTYPLGFFLLMNVSKGGMRRTKS